jgi:hypothetical protein
MGKPLELEMNSLWYCALCVLIHSLSYFLIVKVLPDINSYLMSFIFSIIIPFLCILFIFFVFYSLRFFVQEADFHYRNYISSPIVSILLKGLDKNRVGKIRF